jgi:hypothetical protein
MALLFYAHSIAVYTGFYQTRVRLSFALSSMIVPRLQMPAGETLFRRRAVQGVLNALS